MVTAFGAHIMSSVSGGKIIPAVLSYVLLQHKEIYILTFPKTVRHLHKCVVHKMYSV